MSCAATVWPEPATASAMNDTITVDTLRKRIEPPPQGAEKCLTIARDPIACYVGDLPNVNDYLNGAISIHIPKFG